MTRAGQEGLRGRRRGFRHPGQRERGIVHMAPAFGEDDYQVGRRENLAFFNPVDAARRSSPTRSRPMPGCTSRRPTRRSSRDLEAQGGCCARRSTRHNYPFHDRCGNAADLLRHAVSWFIRTSAMRDQLVAANRDIRWAPPEVGSGRFGNWLAGNVDWALSRNRFWGTPLNVWICDTLRRASICPPAAPI